MKNDKRVRSLDLIDFNCVLRRRKRLDMNKWKAIAILLFIIGFYWFVGSLATIYFMMATVPQGFDPILVVPLMVALGLVPSVVILYGGYRSLRKSRVAPMPRQIARQPTVKPKPSIAQQAEMRAEETVRAQATVFTTALEGIVDYSNIAINLPMSE